MSDTPRTDSTFDSLLSTLAEYETRKVYFSDVANALYSAKADFRTLERDLTAEREKVRVLREALLVIDAEWTVNHDSPFAAGNKMRTCAELALAATEQPKTEGVS